MSDMRSLMEALDKVENGTLEEGRVFRDAGAMAQYLVKNLRQIHEDGEMLVREGEKFDGEDSLSDLAMLVDQLGGLLKTIEDAQVRK